MTSNDTICAIATAGGGAIGIIRISGGEAISIADKIFMPAAKGGEPLKEREANVITFGRIIDKNGEVVDDVLVSLFRAPRSYTGEDSVEISCHGSRYILEKVLRLLIENGCRQATAGEYTQRAFLNGKMDLSQAEAVADLIASQSAATHRMAMSQMRGDFSCRLSMLREKLLKLTSLMELELDFSDHEELEFADRTELKVLTAEIEAEVSRLAGSFRLGNALKNGVPVAIVGETNSGKSTLLNALVGEERAIVSDIHGTTRDVIEDTVNIGGILFRFIDTAGIRDTADTIETLGIERTFKKIREAEIVLWLIDATHAEEQYAALEAKILPLCGGKKLVVVLNKSDLAQDCETALTTLRNRLDNDAKLAVPSSETATPVKPFDSDNSAVGNAPVSETTPTSGQADIHLVSISAKQRTNLPQLCHLLVSCASLADTGCDIIVSNLRHYEALTRALEALRRVQGGLATQLPTDLVAQDLRDCLSALAEITGGEITSEETLQTIFSRFCVGK